MKVGSPVAPAGCSVTAATASDEAQPARADGRSRTSRDTASTAALTARTRRCSQRSAPGKLTSNPRSASAAASRLLTESAVATASSIDSSKSGSLAARKSGNRLNVRRPSGQYHRAIRTPGGFSRA